ncbi:MAG: DUF262 domain-containing protein [Deltaproteobacteria bacterium]|nr:DUF262 domain-containing protein [Deltaproteobacteria bacterium]
MNSYVDRIKPDSYGITTFLEHLRRGQYQIPTFQRDVVWDRNRVKRFWDSIYKFYPLGSILVWRTETHLQNHREIGGYPLRDEPTGKEFHYLLDGQQRTTALLTSIYGGRIKGQDDNDPRLYVDVTVSKPEEVEDESWRERFLFWDEIDDRGGELLRNVGRKKRYDQGLIVKIEDIAHSYQVLEERLEVAGYSYREPARGQLRRFKQVIDNYKLSFIELRGIEVTEVCQIFERINQAGQPLSMFDIVVAKTFRPDRDDKQGFYLRGLFEDFRHKLERDGSRYANIDDMTLLQIMAILVRDMIPGAGVHNITDTYLNVLRTEHLEMVWQDAKIAIRRTFDFLDNHLHLPGPALVPYRYFYMSLASYFFKNNAPDYDLLKRYFWYISFHNDDLLSSTTYLKDHIRRLQEARSGQGFRFDRFLIDRDRLRKTTYSTKGRLSRAILSLYANQDPKDWQHHDRSVLTTVYYTLTDQPNLHHVFPLDFCEKRLGEEGKYANSLLNIAYLTQITNLQISNKNPLDYIKAYISNDFESVKRTHMLPDILTDWAEAEDMPLDALDIFVEERLELLLNCLRNYLNGIQFEIIDTRSQSIAQLASDVDLSDFV